MNQKDICRIIGMSRALYYEKHRAALKLVERKRGVSSESFTATDGRCLSRLFRPIPKNEKNHSILFERALFDARGALAKRQDLVFPNCQAVFPDSGGEDVSVVSIDWVLSRLKGAKRGEDFLFLETGGMFYAEAHNDVVILNPYYVRIMANQIRELQRYGFGDKVTISVWPKEKKQNPPVLFSASDEDGIILYEFLMMPVELPRRAGYLGANVKIN